MHVYTLSSEVEVPKGIAETFEFFEDPRNLSRITPPWLRFIIESEGVEMRKDAEIDYTISWLGLPMKWKTIITEYEPPFQFVDTQAKGPYSLWVHKHTFRPGGHGTVVRDEVKYALPFGLLGRLAHSVMVRGQLEEIFTYRQQALCEILGRVPGTEQKPSIAPVRGTS